MIAPVSLLARLILILALPNLATAGVRTDWDPQRKVRGWLLDQEGLHLELRQIEPDRVRAFFEARGFSRPIQDRLARACVFQTVARNRGDRPLALDQHRWRLDDGRPPHLKEAWLPWLKGQGAPKAARIAFRWATFPTRQVFAPGDYNWGLTLFDRPPGTRFALRLHWRQGGEDREATIRDMQCIPIAP